VEIRYVIPTSPSSEHIRFCHLRTDYFHAPDLAVLLAEHTLSIFTRFDYANAKKPSKPLWGSAPCGAACGVLWELEGKTLRRPDYAVRCAETIDVNDTIEDSRLGR
jgi:hypothetical protein